MVQVTDNEFEDLIGQSLDELPKDYVKKLLKDVAVTWQDDPTEAQRNELQLRGKPDAVWSIRRIAIAPTL